MPETPPVEPHPAELDPAGADLLRLERLRAALAGRRPGDDLPELPDLDDVDAQRVLVTAWEAVTREIADVADDIRAARAATDAEIERLRTEVDGHRQLARTDAGDRPRARRLRSGGRHLRVGAGTPA